MGAYLINGFKVFLLHLRSADFDKGHEYVISEISFEQKIDTLRLRGDEVIWLFAFFFFSFEVVFVS